MRIRAARTAPASGFGPRIDREMAIMKKLSLDVEELEITSFDTAEVREESGTVEAYLRTQGNNYTCDPRVGTCFGYTCIDACP